MDQFNYIFTEDFNKKRSKVVDFDWGAVLAVVLIIAAIVAVSFLAAAIEPLVGEEISGFVEGAGKDIATGKDPVDVLTDRAGDKLASYAPDVPIPKAIKDLVSDVKLPPGMTAEEYRDALLDKILGKDGTNPRRSSELAEKAIASKDKIVNEQMKKEGYSYGHPIVRHL